MSKNMINLFLGLVLFSGLLAFPAQAELGLQQILSDSGVKAVGTAVKTAAEAAYAGDPAQIQTRLIAILNEAAATGDESAITYSIIAVMLAGGIENLEAGKDAINNSDLFTDYQTLTALTVAETEKLMKGDGSKDGKGKLGGGGNQGGDGGGEASDPTLGGGDPEVFDPDGGDIDDAGRHATPV